MARPKPTILVLMGGYWPGHEATGPNQHLKHMLSALASDFDFKIVARDRPPGAPEPSAQSGSWIGDGLAQIRYCRVSRRGAQGLALLLRTTDHDILALNGFFDREFTIPALLLRRMRLVPRKPTVLSVHGEMGAGALSLKAGRKRAYLGLARHAGLLNDVWLHATSPHEAADIAACRLKPLGRLVAPNLCRLVDPAPRIAPGASGGRLRLVFAGRVARVKNLGFALDVLRHVRTPVAFDIFGPIVEPDFWAILQREIATLPAHVQVNYRGEIANDDVPNRIADADLFFLPTLGENFGHAIFEALSCGIPVLISDRTPWQQLERQSAGWSLPLQDPQPYASAIERLAAMSPQQRAALSRGARAVAERFIKDADAVNATRRMFATVLEGRAPFRSADERYPAAATR